MEKKKTLVSPAKGQGLGRQGQKEIIKFFDRGQRWKRERGPWGRGRKATATAYGRVVPKKKQNWAPTSKTVRFRSAGAGSGEHPYKYGKKKKRRGAGEDGCRI